jgi:hypothetical protein
MILSRRQQAVLDRMDRDLGAADPKLRSSFEAFALRARDAPFPAAEVITGRPVRFLVFALVIVFAVGFLAFGIGVLHGGCSSTAWHGGCVMSHNG